MIFLDSSKIYAIYTYTAEYPDFFEYTDYIEVEKEDITGPVEFSIKALAAEKNDCSPYMVKVRHIFYDKKDLIKFVKLNGLQDLLTKNEEVQAIAS